MRLKDLLKGQKGLRVKNSEKKTYAGSNTAICFISLNESLPGTGQDYLVLSRTAAEATMAKPENERMAFVTTLDATRGVTEDGTEVWGVTMPVSGIELGTLDF
jgi:hypothetical protein